MRPARTTLPFATAALVLLGCELLVDTSGLAGSDQTDSGSPSEAGPADGGAIGAGDGATDSGTGNSDVDTPPPPPITSPAFDPGSRWPVFTDATAFAPGTPTFNTSAACTDFIVLANSGVNGDQSATATISTSTGMTFGEAVKDATNNADTIYIWKAANSCASRSGTVTVVWNVTSGGIGWSNVAVFGFTHSKGIGAVANAHNPGDTSINKISITPTASGSWLFASLSGNSSKNASTASSGNFLQQWSGEGAVQTYGPAQIPAATTAGTSVTFSLALPDSIWASAAVEVLNAP